jgi:hypothetical protein
MDRNDQQAIEGLFGKLAEVERQSAPRDAESEAFIRERIAHQPGAPYYMAQTIVVQQQALEAAQARIEELEAQAPESPRTSGEIFGSLFGDNRPPTRSGSVPLVGRPGGTTLQQPIAAAAQAQRGGGGFLAGAAQTAMGVAGGVLLGNALGSLFGGGSETQAAEAPAEEPEAGDSGAGNSSDFGDMEF